LTAPSKSEFSRLFRLDTLGAGARRESIAATPAECAALAMRFGLNSLSRLSADATMTSQNGQIVAAGTYQATATQICVVTGDPLPVRVAEPFKVRFVTADAAIGDEIELNADDCDEMDHDGNGIDLGEAVAQSLGLALDPFPRGPNAESILRDAGVLQDGDVRAFSALSTLKARMDKL
jgi:hypothetical protein